MGITATFSDPFLESGAGSTADVPFLYPVAIDGVGYMVDDTQQFGHASLPLLREQADTAVKPSEQTLSPEELWRRSLESWHRGAGQDHADRPDSDPYRFRTSKGVDVWDRWELSLLPATGSKRSSTATNLTLTVAGAYLYVADGTEAYYTSDVTVSSPTWTAASIQAGEAATTVEDLTSDGFYVYAALGSNGIHRNERGTATTSHFNDLQATLIGYVKGRLMAAKANELFNVTAAGTAPAALFTHPNADFEWVGFAPGKNDIYAAGFSGDKSLVYRTAVKADGTALDTPVIAGELPDGEIVRSIGGYLGYVLIGTDKGVRFCATDDNGNLQVGEIVGPEKSVRCFEGQDRFVWFGWSNYDSTDTGLGRLDLTQFLDGGLAPVYASDLMASAQGDVLSVATFQDIRVFTVSGVGVFAETDSLVESGQVDSGLITFGLPADDKVAMYVDVRHSPLAGSVSISMSTDEGTFEILGSSDVSGTSNPSAPMVANEAKGRSFEIRAALSRSSSDTSDGPTLTRATVRAYPSPPRGKVFITPLLLHEKLVLLDGREAYSDPEEALAVLERLERDRRPVTYQQGVRRETVIVDSLEWHPSHMTADHSWWNGTAVVRLKRFSLK